MKHHPPAGPSAPLAHPTRACTSAPVLKPLTRTKRASQVTPRAQETLRACQFVCLPALLLLGVLLGLTLHRGDASANPPLALASPVEPTRIGVLLPLSGRFAPPGEEVRLGLELALQHVPSSALGPLKLVYRDTQDDPERTGAAAAELIARERVIALIGPLLSNTVDAAVTVAADKGVPIVVLSQKQDIPALGDLAFRNFMSIEQQMRTLVTYAMETLGMKRFGIIYPEQRYGMELVSAFWDAVLARGGIIAAAESYPAKTTDFVKVARTFGLKHDIELRKDEYVQGEREYLNAYTSAGTNAPRPYELPPLIDFDAIFVPDQHRNASLIASSLAYAELPVGSFKARRSQTPIRLLGSAQWNSPELPKHGGTYVDNCLFVDNYFAQSPDAPVRAFVSRFKEVQQRTPTLLSAVGYDALGVLAQALTQRTTERSQLRDRLQQLTGYTGATGEVAFDARGELKKQLYVLSVQQKELVQLLPIPIGSAESPTPVEARP